MRYLKLKRFFAIAAGVFLASTAPIHLSPSFTNLRLAVEWDAKAAQPGESRGGSLRSLPSINPIVSHSTIKPQLAASTITQVTASPARQSILSSTTGELVARRSGGGGGRSGGRSGGGSFRRSPSTSPPSRTTPARPSQPDSRPSYPGGGGGPVIVPVPVGPGPGSYSGGYGTYRSQPQSSTADVIVGLIILLVIGAILFLIVFFVVRAIRRAATGGGLTKQARELQNDTVTVSKIQVALLAQARFIQTELTKLSLEVSTDTEWGLLQLLQESALALLRTPENWSHVQASSQTVKSREQAEALFSQISIAERSKYAVETLTNVGGRVRQQADFIPDPDKDPASYIVVTLLVGTAHDRPLFTEIRTVEALQTALQNLAAIPSEYLLVFELIWTPQDETDSLTYDELLTQYTDMVQI